MTEQITAGILTSEPQPTRITRIQIQRLASLAATQDLVLRCWCAPKSCHGQIVAAAICYLLKGQISNG